MIQVIGTFIDVFFILDLLLNFLTTYEDSAKHLVSDFGSITKNYLSGWFAVDFLSSIPIQWIFPSDASAGDAIRGLKILKLVSVTTSSHLFTLQ